jgi:hypothetical protein
MRVAIRGNYRGIEYEVPANDDGRWRFVLRRRTRRRGSTLRVLPSPGLATPEMAVRAAKAAIDEFLGTPSDSGLPRTLAQPVSPT